MSDFGFRYHRVRDPDMLTNRTLDRAVVRRVWRFARAYRLLLVVLLASILVASLVEILPPLVFREIIDKHAIPRATWGASTGWRSSPWCWPSPTPPWAWSSAGCRPASARA